MSERERAKILEKLERLTELKRFIDQHEGKREFALVLLSKAGFDDQTLDYLSDGLWTERKGIIGASLADRYPKPQKPGGFRIEKPTPPSEFPGMGLHKVTKDPYK